ncbi:hypothetical protein BT96DRAFT_790318, partial [Gymnopus androsaceus JB14]
FFYGDLSAEMSNLTAGLFTGTPSVGGRVDLWDSAATLTIQITNNGSVAGTEIAQLYTDLPKMLLISLFASFDGFEKVTIEPGES